MRRPGTRFVPTSVATPPTTLTSPPEPAPSASSVAKRRWNPAPPDLQLKPKSGADTRPSRVDPQRRRASLGLPVKPEDGPAVYASKAAATPTVRPLALPAKPQQRKPKEATEPEATGHLPSPRVAGPSESRRQQLEAHDKQLKAQGKRDPLKSAVVLKSLRQQDVDAEAVRPLIEIAYWSPFVEVRRDAAAALASLSRNAANLDMMFEMGTLGALVSMLGSAQDRNDASISRDCAQTLAALVRLNPVKLLLLESPDRLDCVFSLLHSTDSKLKQTAFELVNNLVTIDATREAVAKREGFGFMLASCTSKDTRLRSLSAAILHQLAASKDNRLLFYHSSHFETLGDILCNPYLEKDPVFRRELLGFVLALLSEAENARRFTERRLLPSVLAILDSPKTTYQISLTVVAIIEAVATNRENHDALVASNALPRLVQLCFSPNAGSVTCSVSKSVPVTPVRRRPSSAAGSSSSSSSTASGKRSTNTKDQVSTLPPSLFAQPGVQSETKTLPTSRPMSARVGNLSWDAAEVSTIIRTAFTIFCELAKNQKNREHIIRSKLLDYIASRNLYASSDKRVRRSVLTLLTLLICKEREHDRRPALTNAPPQLTNAPSRRVLSIPGSPGSGRLSFVAEHPHTFMTAECDYKHYIELLARGVVKCLFGILNGNDFSMKIDAIGAIAQLTEDDSSRLTMCKPQLLQSLKEFAFHPLVQTRYHIAKIIANFAEKQENCLKLVDEGMLEVLVKYISPTGGDRHNDILFQATRAIAAMSKLNVSRGKLVESGVLGTLIQFCKASTTTPNVHANAIVAIRNLRHDAAALRIQAIYRGWCVRARQDQNPASDHRKKVRRVSSMRKHRFDSSINSVIERFIAS